MEKSWDPTWEKVFQSQEWGKYPEVNLVRFIARNFYKALDRNKVRILDVGGGTGANSWYIAREGFDVYVIDGSETAIKILKNRFEKEGLKSHTYVGDVINLPFEDNFFDGVVEVECLSCNTLKNVQRIVDEIHRVLKPKGKVYSQFLGKETWGFNSGKKIEEGTYKDITEGDLAGKGIIHSTDENEIKNLFSRFSKLDIERMDWTHQRNNIREYIIIATK